jgi:hypothetical protein
MPRERPPKNSSVRLLRPFALVVNESEDGKGWPAHLAPVTQGTRLGGGIPRLEAYEYVTGTEIEFPLIHGK